jgi:predicted TIM-barrel fold metal-dependent hydrolase
MTLPLKALEDAEGERLPSQLPPVVDAHVHLFPDGVFEALWRWFEKNAWPVRYKLRTPQVLEFLFSRGVSRVVALHYAHKPGMARALNAYVAALCRQDTRILGMATVLPGEPGASEILAEAFRDGLRGVKLHCHVQSVSPDAPQMHEVYAACAAAGKPLVIHAGREPKSPAYAQDTYALCAAERIERVLQDWPALRICVPHLGADEFDAYERLLERYDNLWLDTTMAVAGYLPFVTPWRLLQARPERILYGTDFPNLPYAWDREIKVLSDLGISEDLLEKLVGANALALYGGP